MTVATFPSSSAASASSSRISSNPPTTTSTATAKIRKLSLASYSSSQSHFASKKLRLLSSSNSNAMASSTPLPATSLSRSSSTSTTSSTRSRPSLTLDLSNLPALSRPSPPTNTLIITELHNLLIFQPPCLAAIREKITSVAPLNSFSPLPSFRRIVCSFLSIEDAVKVRQDLESASNIFDECGLRTRIYFGEHTPIESTEEAKRKKLLEAPHAQKLFFISPPPSPPHGWVMRNEEPPNKEVHASDLADALARLGTAATSSDVLSDPLSPVSVESSSDNIIINNNNNNNKEVTGRTGSWPSSAGAAGGRSRSSTLIFHPNDHGGSPNLPAVMVVDTSIEDDDDDDIMSLDGEQQQKKIFAHTSRPPVELMG